MSTHTEHRCLGEMCVGGGFALQCSMLFVWNGAGYAQPVSLHAHEHRCIHYTPSTGIFANIASPSAHSHIMYLFLTVSHCLARRRQ